MTKNSRFALVGLVIAALLIVAISALMGASSQARMTANVFATAYSMPRLEDATAPELRIWLVQGESGLVTGYVVRSGEVRVYDTDPRLASRNASDVGLPRPQIVQTYAADDLIRMIPRLRRVRLGHCQLVMDGGSVVVEAKDRNGYFAFAADNHEACEGWNLHVLDYALNTLDSIRTGGG